MNKYYKGHIMNWKYYTPSLFWAIVFRICLLRQGQQNKTKQNKTKQWDYIKKKGLAQQRKPSTKQKGNLFSGRSICKFHNQKGVNQNIWRTQPIQYQKTNNPMKTRTEDPNGHFSKDIHVAITHMKRCSTSLIIRKMQIKTTMRYYLTPVRMAKIKNTNVLST